MKFLKVMLIIFVTFLTAALGVLFLLQGNKERGYVDIYGEDEVAY